jgi:hypothetical protein
MKYFAFNRAVCWGMSLLSLVWLFFFAIFLEWVFQSEVLLKYFFTPIHEASSFNKAVLCIGVPFLAILVNLNSVLKGKIWLKNGFIHLGLQIEINFYNWLIILLGLVSLSLMAIYLVLDNGLTWFSYLDTLIYDLIRLFQQIF